MLKHKLRRTAAKQLDGILPYTSYPIGEKEYLGTFDGSVDECISFLKENNYHYQMFAAIKRLDGSEDQGSYARIARKHPSAVSGTRLAQLDPRECQYHVHVYGDGDTTKLYGHYEIHPYPWTPTWDMRRPWPRHYRPTKDTNYNDREDYTYLRGIVDYKLTEQVTNDTN